MPKATNVCFGVPGRTSGRPFPQGGAGACNVQTFGDPAPGQPERCWYAPRISAGGSNGRYRNDDYDRPAPRRYRGDPEDY